MKVNKREKKRVGFYVLKILKPSLVVKIYKSEIEEFRLLCWVLFCVLQHYCHGETKHGLKVIRGNKNEERENRRGRVESEI